MLTGQQWDKPEDDSCWAFQGANKPLVPGSVLLSGLQFLQEPDY